MPKVTKQSANAKPLQLPSFPQGSVLGRIIDVTKLKRAPLKALIYGGNRVGKTTLACQAKKPLLLMSFEPIQDGGAASVRKVQGVHYIHVVPDASPLLQNRSESDPEISMDEALELLQYVKENGGFETAVCDGATSLEDIVYANLLKLPAVPDQKSILAGGGKDIYIERSKVTRACLRWFMDLPIDTIILAKEMDHNPPKEEKYTSAGKLIPDMSPRFLRGTQTKSFVSAALGGATVGWLRDTCNWIIRMWQDEELIEKEISVGEEVVKQTESTGRYVRYLRLKYHPVFDAGPRADEPENVPEVIIGGSPQELWSKLLKAIG